MAIAVAAAAYYQGDPESALSITATSAAVSVSTDPQRAVFSRVQKWLSHYAGASDEQFIITEAGLRVENLLQANKNSYHFDLYEGTSSTDRPTEVKLNRNDLFFVTHLALLIGKNDESTTPKQYGNFPLFTHPDPNYFVGAPAGVPKEYVALETVYNGTLQFDTANVSRFGPFPTNLLKYVPEAQYQKFASPQLNDEFPQFGPHLEGRGFHRLTPNVIIDGQQTNKFVLTLGQGNYAAIEGAVNQVPSAVNTRNYVALLLHGFRVISAAQAAKAHGHAPQTF